MLSEDDDQSGSGSENDSPVAPDSQGYWPIERIIKEKGKKFLVKWKGNDPNTGKPWSNDWVNKTDCSKDLVREWEEEKAAKKAKKKRKSSTTVRRKSTSAASLPPAPPARSRNSVGASKHLPMIRVGSDGKAVYSDDEPLVGSSSRKRRKVEINGRAVAQHVTYTSGAKSKGKQPAKVTSEKDSESDELDEQPDVSAKSPAYSRPRPIFGPKSAQDKAQWKRQSLGSLQSPRPISRSPAKKPEPPKTALKTTPLPKVKLKVVSSASIGTVRGQETGNKRKRDASFSEDDEKEESSDDAERTVADNPPRLLTEHRASSRTTAEAGRTPPSKPASVVKPVPARRTEKEKPMAGPSAGEPISDQPKRTESKTSTIGFDALRQRAEASAVPQPKAQSHRGRSKSPRDTLRHLSAIDPASSRSTMSPSKSKTSENSRTKSNPVATDNEDSNQEQENDPWTGQPAEQLVPPIRAIEPDWDDEEVTGQNQLPAPDPFRKGADTLPTGDGMHPQPEKEPQSGDDDYDPLALTPAGQPLPLDGDYDDVDPLAKEPTPPPAPSLRLNPPVTNHPEQLSQDLPSQGTNTSKGTIIPDSQPERVSQSSNGTQKSARSQSHPAPAPQPKEPLPVAMARANSHQGQLVVSPNPVGQSIPPRLDFTTAPKLSKGLPETSDSLSAASRERLRAIAASGPSNGKKPLGPVRNISPSVFRDIASKAAPQPDEVDDILDSPLPSSNPKRNGSEVSGKDSTPSQESEQNDFSGQQIRERDWAAAGLREQAGPEKKRKALNAFFKIPAFVQASPAKASLEQGEIADQQAPDEVPGREKSTPQLPDARISEIAELKARMAELESNVSQLEAQNSSLKEAESAATAQADYARSQYEQVAGRATEIAMENQALEKEKRRLDKENARLSQQNVTAVAQIRLTLQAELKAVKEESRRKAHIADTLLHQARRTGIRLPADDGKEVVVSADEVRRRAADWWQLKKEREELEAALEEKIADSERRETVLSMMRDEEEDKKKKAIRKGKELERKIAELQSKIEDLEQQKQSQVVASEDDDVFLCEWVLESERGEPEKRCRVVTTSREACAAHVSEAHVQETPLPETAPLPHSSEPSSGQPVPTH